MDYHGLSWIIMDYHGLSWTIMDYHGLTWTIMDYLMDRHTDTQINGHLVHCSVAIMTENQKKNTDIIFSFTGIF